MTSRRRLRHKRPALEVSQHDAHKQDEEEALQLFLDAYRRARGQRVTLEETRERPDFVCRRANGHRVGIELTLVFRDRDPRKRPPTLSDFLDPASAGHPGVPTPEQVDRSLHSGDYLWGEVAWEHIGAILSEKEAKRAAPGWHLADRTVLVLQLVETPVSELASSAQSPEEFEGHGFMEVWAADYSGVAAYGDVELFGIFPKRLWGYYPNELRSKPYG